MHGANMKTVTEQLKLRSLITSYILTIQLGPSLPHHAFRHLMEQTFTSLKITSITVFIRFSYSITSSSNYHTASPTHFCHHNHHHFQLSSFPLPSSLIFSFFTNIIAVIIIITLTANFLVIASFRHHHQQLYDYHHSPLTLLSQAPVKC